MALGALTNCPTQLAHEHFQELVTAHLNLSDHAQGMSVIIGCFIT